MAPVMRLSVGCSYKLEVMEEKESPVYHRMAMNQKHDTAIKETNGILYI